MICHVNKTNKSSSMDRRPSKAFLSVRDTQKRRKGIFESYLRTEEEAEGRKSINMIWKRLTNALPWIALQWEEIFKIYLRTKDLKISSQSNLFNGRKTFQSHSFIQIPSKRLPYKGFIQKISSTDRRPAKFSIVVKGRMGINKGSNTKEEFTLSTNGGERGKLSISNSQGTVYHILKTFKSSSMDRSPSKPLLWIGDP